MHPSDIIQSFFRQATDTDQVDVEKGEYIMGQLASIGSLWRVNWQEIADALKGDDNG